jgi:Domain of unknown function (DUF4157)
MPMKGDQRREDAPSSLLRAALESPGVPVERDLRQRAEQSLGTDLSGVRVHTGPLADTFAQAVNARAYTVGEHVGLADEVVSSSAERRQTLAHELAHVVQQRAGRVDGVPGPDGLRVSDPADRFERAADRAADATLAGREANPLPGPAGAPSAAQPTADTAPPVHTFADGRTVSLKADAATVQRKIGNWAKDRDPVWFDPQISGVTEYPRGRIVHIAYESWKLKASKKHKKIGKVVKNYRVRLDQDSKYVETNDLGELSVGPKDPLWHTVNPATLAEEDKPDAESDSKSDEREGVSDRLVLKATARQNFAELKAVAQAGLAIGKAAKATVGKASYFETKSDEVVGWVQKATGALDKASHFFPPAKVVTTPLHHAVGGVSKGRKLYHLKQLWDSGDEAIPLNPRGAFDEAQELLAAVARSPQASDDEGVPLVERAAEAMEVLYEMVEVGLTKHASDA